MEKALPWMILKSVPGIGNHLFKRLIERFNRPELVFEAANEDLLRVEGLSPRLAKAIHRHKVPETVKKDFDLVMRKGYKIITMIDHEYPPLLLQIPDPPPFLYLFGRLDSTMQNIAVVGSRNATSYGIATTTRLCASLASLKITIASGMARGIDTAAHQGALSVKGRTIAVLGSGLEKVYPAENLKLFHEIAENGAVISEFPLLTEPEAHHFPVRNRIISGISHGTVIVEATKRSGSLITARLAGEQGREVFAVPGSIHSFKSTGTHSLIKQGAKLVENAQDIMEELSHLFRVPLSHDIPDQKKITKESLRLEPDEIKVFEAIGPYPVHVDDLVRKIFIEPGKLSSILLRLELKGLVQQSPGNFFSKSEKEPNR
jgi:DNA processing protein